LKSGKISCSKGLFKQYRKLFEKRTAMTQKVNGFDKLNFRWYSDIHGFGIYLHCIELHDYYLYGVGALFELKRKKMFEAEVAKLQGARITLDSQIIALESASINMETVKAMKVGADAMKHIHGNL
jgi:hypothetical protein